YNLYYFNYQTNNRIIDLQFADRYANAIIPAETSVEEFKADKDPYKFFVVSDNLASAAVQLRNDVASAPGFANYSEMLRWDIIPDPGQDGQGNDLTSTVNYRVPLGLFKRTAWELDKMIHYPDQMGLRINWLASNNLAFTSGSATDPFAGTPAVIAGVISVSNLRLVLHMEADAAIDMTLKADAMTGKMQIPISYIWPIKQTFASAGSQITNALISP